MTPPPPLLQRPPAEDGNPGRIARLLRGPAGSLAVALVLGALHALSFAPAGLPWLELIALGAIFLLVLRARNRGGAFALGFFFGLGWFGIGLYWIYISLHEYGGLWSGFAALATAALASILAVFPCLACGAAAACAAPGSGRRALALVAAWTIADWARGIAFTGLPWLATGYAHTDGPFAGYAPVLGVYGVGAMAALAVAIVVWAAASAPGAARRLLRVRSAAAALAVLAIVATGMLLRTHAWSQDAGAPIRVRLVQGNIAQDVKFARGGLDDAVERYLPQVEVAPDHAGAPPDLIVLPESAFPIPYNGLPEELLDRLHDARLRGGAALIFGAFLFEEGEHGEDRYFNSAVGLGASGSAALHYSKRHLVPFGEFIPTGFHWFVRMLDIPIGDQERGADYQRPMALAGEQIAVNICFEDLFGALLRDAWRDPAAEPTMLLNLSNLAWFDDSSALSQHLQIARMRALETARPVLRATNTGITAIIDAHGRVTARMPMLEYGALDGTVQGTRGTTPFLRLGNLPVLLFAAACLAACLPWRGKNTPETAFWKT